MHVLAKLVSATSLFFFLSACFIPDQFNLEVSVPSASEVGWKFNGKWHFFFAGYDPRRNQLPPKDLIALTGELGKLPGSLSVAHIERNIWKQSIAWRVRLRNAQNKPATVLFPTATQPSGGPDYWLLRVIPESETSVLLETLEPPKGGVLRDLLQMGYKSGGTFALQTPGTVEQISGPTLSKSWFGSTYSTTLNLFQGAPIKVRIKW